MKPTTPASVAQTPVNPGWTAAHVILPLAALICLMPFMSAALALLVGIALALSLGNPYLPKTRALTHRLLTLSVMGLGAGMDLNIVGKVGLQGVGYTVCGITLAFVIGTLLGKVLKTERDTSLLITVGTAICGGSAIAAVAPTIQAKDHEVSVALGTIFILNAVGLMLFPVIGHHLDLSQTQFGLWSALAIHDTSSVVGATLQYGARALQVGTTVKLARALWIVPVTLVIGYLSGAKKKNSQSQTKPKRPWFILGFILAAAIVTWIPSLKPAGHLIDRVAERGLVLTLFLIGTNLTWSTLRSVGIRPMLQGILLWFSVGSLTLVAISMGWIHL